MNLGIRFLFLCGVVSGSVWSAERAVRTYYPKARTIEFQSKGKTISVNVNPEFNKILYEPADLGWRGDEEWRRFFQKNIGRDINWLKQVLFEEIVMQIEKDAVEPEALYCSAFDLAEHLRQTADRSISRDRFSYDPYELLLIGPTTEEETNFLFAALLSALCFPVEILDVYGKWVLSIPPSQLEKKEAYHLDGGNFRVIYHRYESFDADKSEILGLSIPIESMCLSRTKYHKIKNFSCEKNLISLSETDHDRQRTIFQIRENKFQAVELQ